MSYKKEKKADRKKVLLIIVCVFAALVVIFGATLGIVLGVRNAKAAVRFNGVRISEGEAYFLLTKYKRDFIIEYGGHDSESFFASKYDDTRTYADLLKEESERYLKDIAVKNYLFDSIDGIDMSGLDEIAVRRAIR